MKKKNTTILLIEDNPGDARLVRETLADSGAGRFELVTETDLAAGLAAVSAQPVQAVLLDLTLPDSTGLDTFVRLHAKTPQIPIIVLTGADDDVLAAQAVREGAQDYLVKGQVSGSLLVRSIRYAIERKRVEQSLALSHERYRLLFENSGTGVIILDENGRYILANQITAENLGKTPQDLVGKSIFDFLPQKVAEHYLEFNHQLIKAGGQRRYEDTFVLPTGERTFLIIDQCLQDENGRNFAVQSSSIDITAEKQAQQLSRDTEERYRMLFETAPIAINITRGTDITYANPSYQRLFGFSNMEELKRLSPGESFTPEFRPKILENIQRRANGLPVPDNYEAECLKKDGTRFPVLMYITRTIFADGPATVAFVMDNTQRKQAEQAVVQKTMDLGERVKELSCLYGISKLTSESDKSIQEIFTAAVHLIPPGWNYPEKTCARIVYKQKEYVTENFRQTRWYLSADLLVSGKVSGSVAVYYLGEDTVQSRSPFLIEERDLIDELARDLGNMVETRQAGEALRLAEGKYRSIFENAVEGIHQTTFDGKIISVNPAGTRMLGFDSPEELMADLNLTGNQFYVKPGRREEFQQLMETNGAVSEFESEVYRKDGSKAWISENTHSVLDGDGNLLYYEGTSVDITERKLSEQALRENEARYRAIFDGSSLGIAFGDLNGRFVSINHALQEILGYSLEELSSKTMADLTHPDDLASDFALFQETLAGKRAQYQIEKRYFHKDGHLVWANIRVSLVRNHKGQPEFAIGMIEDITERKQMEQVINLSEARYRNLVQNQSDIIARSDLSGRLTFVNDAYCRAFGLTPDQLLMKDYFPTLVPEDLPIAIEAMQAIKQPPYRKQTETRHSTLAGIRWFSWENSAVLDEAGNIIELQGVGRDITERKLAEEARLESELLLRALFELSPDSIILMDPHTPDDSWPIVDCNATACRINGYSRAELIGNSIDMVNAFPADPAERSAYRKKMRAQESPHLEALHRRKDGTVFPVEISTRLIQVGKRELVIGIDRDITERKQVEQALQESEQRFREIFENMSNGVVVYEALDAGNDFRINNFNRAAEKIESIARETVIGKTVCEAFPGVKEFGLFESLQRVWKNGQPENLPITYYTDARKSGWRENYIARLPSGEILVVYDDVTEQRQAEESLRASEELFRTFIEQSSEGVVLLDEQGTVIEWNHAQSQMTGLPSEEAVGRPMWDIQYALLPPERRSQRNPEFFKNAMQDAFRTGKFPTAQQSVEARILTPQAETRYILQSSFPIHSGKGYRIGSLVRDITAAKRAEMELQASHAAEKEFSEHLSALSEVTTNLSKTGSLDDTCRRAVELGRQRLGFDRLSLWFISDDHTSMQGTFGVDAQGQITDERKERFLIGPDFPVWNLVKGRQPLVHIPGESLYLNGQVIGQGDHVFAGLWDGDNVAGYISVDNLLSQRPFSDHDCEIIRLYASAVGQLISLKRAEASLRTSEEHYRGAIAAAGLVPYGIDYETGQFTFMGDNILQLTGYSAEELTPAILKESIQESHVWGLENTGITEQDAPQRFRSGEIKQWGSDLRIITRSGEERWLSDVSVPLTDKLGKVTSAIGIFQDLTGRKRAEQDLLKSDARFRSIFENTSIGFYQTTPSGQILLANPAILHMLGYTSFEDLAQRNLEVQDFQTEYPRREFRQRIERDGEVKDLESAWKRIDNTIVYVRENTRVVRDSTGTVLYYEGTAEDITERRHAEQKLRAASSYNRRLIEASIDPLVAIGPDGKITDVNEATEAVTGVPRTHLIGDEFTDYFTDADKARQSYQKVLAEGLVRDYPLTIRHTSGKTTEVLYNATVYKNEAGEIQGVFAAARDITERKQAEAALINTERIYRQAITGAGGVPYQVDYATDCYVFMGEGFESLTGFLPSEVVGSAFFTSHIRQVESYGENKELSHDQRVQMVRQEGSLQEWREDYLFERKDGRLVWLSDHSVPVMDDAGNLIGSLGILMDITERKKAEQNLRESEERFRFIFENANDSIFIENGNDEILSANRRACEMLGYNLEELQKLHVSDIQAPEVRRTGYVISTEISLHGNSIFEGLDLTHDGQRVPVEVSVGHIDQAAGDLYVSIVRDITERKQAEQALRESEQHFHSLFENMIEGVALHELIYDESHKPVNYQLVDCNPQYEQIIGKKRNLVKGVVATEVYQTPEPPYLKEYSQVAESGNSTHFETFFAPMNKYFSISVAPWGEAGFATIFSDVTDRMQSETEMARRDEELRQRNEELARLYRASGSLLSGASSSLQELAETIVGIIQHEFGQANCSLLLVQRDSNELQRLAAAGPYTDQVRSKTLTLDGPGLIPQAIRSGQTVNVGNVHSVLNYLPNWELAMSEMAVPLKIGNDVIGVIDTQSALPDAFDTKDEGLMTIFAERAALALEHSRLYEQTEARVQQLAALRTVDMAISSSFDIHLTLDILLDQVRAQLGVHAADILGYNQVTQTFWFSCGQGFRTHALQHTHLRLGEGYAGKAAMERRLLKVPDLHAEPSGFGRSPLLVGENFVSYAGVPLVAKGQIKGVLEVFHRDRLELNPDQQSFLEILAGQAGIAMDNAELYDHQQKSIADLTIAYNDTLEGWASALELRDKETEGHTRRVTDLTIRLARSLGVNESEQVQIYRGALLHDIGKIGVPDAIVLKPGPLTDAEWEIMRQHPTYAYNMLSPIGYLREALIIPYCHHEKWDGTGYPRGLKGEEIPLSARLFSVVDVWDALTSDRPYRKAWTHEKARLYIAEQSGTQFEPKVVETFLREVLSQ